MSMDRNDQLLLTLPAHPSATFETFVTPPNEAAAHFLRKLADGEAGPAPPHQGLLWGPTGSGKTHLLQAFCRTAAERGARVASLPMGELVQAGSTLLDGLEGLDAICLDDIDAVAGREAWELALFTLVNACRRTGTMLLMSASHSPRALELRLPDLASRLLWSAVFRLRPLDDAGRMRALQRHAHNRGFSIPEEVLGFLLRRGPRHMSGLMQVLDTLDRRSLIHQRRVTIALAREALALLPPADAVPRGP